MAVCFLEAVFWLARTPLGTMCHWKCASSAVSCSRLRFSLGTCQLQGYRDLASHPRLILCPLGRLSDSARSYPRAPPRLRMAASCLALGCERLALFCLLALSPDGRSWCIELSTSRRRRMGSPFRQPSIVTNMRGNLHLWLDCTGDVARHVGQTHPC